MQVIDGPGTDPRCGCLANRERVEDEDDNLIFDDEDGDDDD